MIVRGMVEDRLETVEDYLRMAVQGNSSTGAAGAQTTRPIPARLDFSEGSIVRLAANTLLRHGGTVDKYEGDL